LTWRGFDDGLAAKGDVFTVRRKFAGGPKARAE